MTAVRITVGNEALPPASGICAFSKRLLTVGSAQWAVAKGPEMRVTRCDLRPSLWRGTHTVTPTRSGDTGRCSRRCRRAAFWGLRLR